MKFPVFAIAAAVMLDGVTSRLTPVFGSDFDASGLLTPKGGGGARGEVPFVVREAFAFGLHHTFWTMAFIALGGTLLTVLMPRGKAQDIRAASLEPVERDGLFDRDIVDR